MICPKCGKEIPAGSKFCNFCGAVMPEPAPRHARPEPELEEIFSFSDEKRHEADVFDTEVEAAPADAVDDMTKVFHIDKKADYDLSLFETPNGEHVPEPESPVQPYDDREFINDSYENYSDGQDDLTFMDKLDNKFRRDDDRQKPDHQPKSKTWIWIALTVVAVLLFALIIVTILSSAKTGDRQNTKPTAPTAPVAATVQATEAPAPTDAPATQPPATQPPATEPPATEAPAPTDPPATEAPAPTDPPIIPTEAQDDPAEIIEENVDDQVTEV